MSSEQRLPNTAPASSQSGQPTGTRERNFDPALESGILVVLPHPDDESFASGGTLARASAAGVSTTYLCGTYGDMGRRMGKPAFTNREALRDVRTLELQEACAVLGCQLRFMGLRDKCVEFEDPAGVGSLVASVIGELQPSVVITFYPGHGVHPDHDALGHATVLAVRSIQASQRPKVLAVAVGEREQILKELGEPHYLCDISEFASRKIDALRAHRSQTEVMFAQWDAAAKPNGGSPATGPVGASDEQTQAFRDQFTKSERFYLIDPDQPTLLENRG